MEERSIKISLERAREWYNRGGEYKELALSAFTENEIITSALSNTWEEFCKMYPVINDEWYIDSNLNLKTFIHGTRFCKVNKNVLPSKQAAKAHLAYMQLHQLRDCYRQGWLPDWRNDYQIKWAIYLDEDKFKVEYFYCVSRFLSFQSKEIAEKFLKNFKGLIETAGDLI